MIASVDVAAYGAELAAGIEAALPGWVESSVARIVSAWCGSVAPDVASNSQQAGRLAAQRVGPEVRALLALDVDEQRTTPLAILRQRAVPFPTEVLAAAGVPPVARDRGAAALFPDDVYDLSPASFADLGPELAEVGLRWGAAKAFEHMRRHRRPRPGAPGAGGEEQ